MNVGMLWFDGDGDSRLDDRVKRAAEYYRSKYGRRPNACFIHPTMVPDELSGSFDGVAIHSSDAVLPEHFWLGIEETPAG